MVRGGGENAVGFVCRSWATSWFVSNHPCRDVLACHYHVVVCVSSRAVSVLNSVRKREDPYRFAVLQVIHRLRNAQIPCADVRNGSLILLGKIARPMSNNRYVASRHWTLTESIDLRRT